MADEAKDYQTSESFKAASELLREMKHRAWEAQEHDDVEMVKLFNQIVRLISPVVAKLYQRLDRHENAALNKGAKKIVKADWERKQSERENNAESA